MTDAKTIAPILIAYYSTHGSTQLLAEMIAQGVESQGVEAMLRQVPRVSDNLDSTSAAVPLSGPPYVTVTDLASCSGKGTAAEVQYGCIGKIFFRPIISSMA